MSVSVGSGMTESTLELPPNSTVPLGLSTPGDYMQQARLALDLSIDAVAARLKISPANLLALESDQFERLPGETFVRGYIRAYAKLLGIDCDAALANYEDYLRALRDTTVQVTRDKDAENTAMPLSRRRQIAVVLTAVVIVVVLSVVFSLSDSGELSLGANTALIGDEQSRSVEPSTLPNADLSLDVGENAQFINDAAIGQKTAVEVISDAREVKAQAAATIAPAVLIGDQLSLSFSSECWVEIADARGDVLFTDIKQAGESLSLKGKAPFNVMLGDVRSATIVLNGEPVIIRPKTKSKALRFKVGGETPN